MLPCLNAGGHDEQHLHNLGQDVGILDVVRGTDQKEEQSYCVNESRVIQCARTQSVCYYIIMMSLEYHLLTYREQKRMKSVTESTMNSGRAANRLGTSSGRGRDSL